MTRLQNQRLKNLLREKTKQLEQMQQISSQLESRVSKLRKELEEVSDKLIASDNERSSLRNELARLQQELDFGKDQMIRKTDEFQSALEEWATAHRQAEDARLNAVHELENKKYELADLQSRLDSTDQRLQYLTQEFYKADNERDALRDSLRKFQNSINRVTGFRRATVSSRAVGRPLQGVDDPKGGSAEDPAVVIYKSTPLPADLGDGEGGDPSASSTAAATIDLANLDKTLQDLVTRLDTLQRERVSGGRKSDNETIAGRLPRGAATTQGQEQQGHGQDHAQGEALH